MMLMLVAMTATAGAQSIDSVKVVPDTLAADSLAVDPLRYRLLAMTTGEIMPKGSVAMGIHEVVVFTINAAPLEFLQIGAVVYPELMDGNDPNWLATAKVPVYAGDGLVRGIAAGVNVGTGWPMMKERPYGVMPSYFLAGTIGNENVQFHLTLNGVFTYNSDKHTPLPMKPVQFGVSVPSGTSGKMMLETVIVENGGDRYSPLLWFAGYRGSGELFTWELGVVVLPGFPPESHGATVPLPFGSLSLCF